ncbi:germin-like protein subfamily 2 member 1 [Carica papaya]|uniref:germin-like protein subfamily 2 member 1 n=1 Tax=Carica papaya TaxID=3649 RepID=UPI000B8CBB07|nr:germin-like protein subfamily 2 member 1 [Carica papaya]
MATIVNIFLVSFVVALVPVLADYDMLQDICVADLSSSVKINGYPCKDTTSVSENDFFFNGLIKPGSTNNSKGYIVTGANVEKIPGLNTLGVSMSRIDYAPGGVNPPHTHLRASEIVFVLQGQLQVGFITSANKLISKTINAGEVFVFPKGLVHFQENPHIVPKRTREAHWVPES